MNRSIFSLTALLMLSCIIGFPGTSLAGQQADEADETDAAKVLGQIRTEIEAENWKGVADSMTAGAWDSFCAQLVVDCISIADIDGHLPIPGFKDAQDEIVAALEKHGLEKVEIKFPSIEIRMGDDEDPDRKDKSESDVRAAKNAQENEVIKHLDESGERMEIVGDLWEAKSTSPFAVSVFMGKIKEEIVDGDTVIVKVTPAQPKVSDDDGSIVIAIPPVFVNINNVDGDWKFAGTNHEKTDQARKKFKPPMHGGLDF